MLGMSDKRDHLSEQLTNASIIKDEAVRELLHLISPSVHQNDGSL